MSRLRASIIPLRPGCDRSAGSAAEPRSSGAECASPGTRPERYRRKAGRLIHRLLGLRDTAGAIFFSQQCSLQLFVVGDAQASLSGKAKRDVVGEMLRPIPDVHPIDRIVRNIGHVDRREIGVPEPRLIAILQQRRVHVRRSRDLDGSHPIDRDREAIVETELRREGGTVVDLDGTSCELPQALRPAVADHVRPIRIEDATRLAWFRQARELTLAEMAERLVVDEELCGHEGLRMSDDGRSGKARGGSYLVMAGLVPAISTIGALCPAPTLPSPQAGEGRAGAGTSPAMTHGAVASFAPVTDDRDQESGFGGQSFCPPSSVLRHLFRNPRWP